MKKKGKKLISIALTVAMIAGLTACGKGNGGDGKGGGQGGGGEPGKKNGFFKKGPRPINDVRKKKNYFLVSKEGRAFLLFLCDLIFYQDLT